MRGSAAFRTGIAPGGALAGPWVRDPLWTRARAVPSLDLRFAENKSLVDAVTGAQLVTFTRASSGTFVGSEGVIRTATTNLITTSEALTNVTGASITNNTTTAPDGLITADTLTEDTSTGAHSVNTASITWLGNTVYTFTIFLKANTRNQVNLAFGTSSNWVNSQRSAVFDLSTGTVASSAGSPVVASIETYLNGWYRCRLTATTVASPVPSTMQIQMYVSGSTSYTGNGTSGLFFWGAQLEASSSPGEYIPTSGTINSAPRFDHNPTTGESLGLLVEEARTNLVLQSEDLSTSWTNTNTTETTNAATAPDGTTTADKLVETATTTEHNIRQDSTSQAAGTYTFSIFAKAAERTFLQFAATGVLGSFRANFNIGAGTLGSSDSELITSIVPYGNGWYKCIVTRTTTTAGTLRAQWNIVTSSTAARVESYAGDGTSGLLLWGAQLEAGAFPTSYIPTTTATVTRSADVASISGSNFSSWYNQTEGTFAWSGSTYNTQYANQNAFRVTEGTNLRGIGFGLDARTGTDDAYFSTRNNTNITSVNSSSAYVTVTSNIRIGGAFGTDIAASFNGSTPLVASPAYVFGTENQMEIMGNKQISGTANQYNGHTRRLTYWPTRLSNEVLQRITQ